MSIVLSCPTRVPLSSGPRKPMRQVICLMEWLFWLHLIPCPSPKHSRERRAPDEHIP